MIIKESNTTVNVRDLERSISFYQSLGLTIKRRWANYYAVMEAAGVLIGLHPTELDPSGLNSGTVSIGFTIDNFEAARAILLNDDVPITERQEEGGKFIHFKDPDGTALYFVEPKRPG